MPVDQYQRVVGYFSTFKGTNKGKKEEIRERKKYTPAEIQIAMRKEIKKGLDYDEIYT